MSTMISETGFGMTGFPVQHDRMAQGVIGAEPHIDSNGEVWAEDEELTFPSFPKRFHSQPNDEDSVDETEAGSESVSSFVGSDIEHLLGKDESVTTNADFWREVRTSCDYEPSSVSHGSEQEEEHSNGEAQAPSSPLSPHSPLSPLSHDSITETRLEDFIRDIGSLNSASPDNFQPDFQIKRLCFRDADGKLALTASGGSHVHKPSSKNPRSSKKLMRRVLRRKSALWEMASPNFAVAEFMLL